MQWQPVARLRAANASVLKGEGVRLALLIAPLIAMTICGCARDPSPVTLAVADRESAYVTLAAEGEHVLAAWAAAGSAGTDVFVASSGDGGRHFDAPRRVNDLPGDAVANGEQPPRIAMQSNRVVAVWVAKAAATSVIRVADSDNGGQSFGPARTISPAALHGARGWESVALSDDGIVHTAWLDGRNAVTHASSNSHAAHSGMAHAGSAPR